MDENHRSELKQLWFVAEEYLKLANKRAEYLKDIGYSSILDEAGKNHGELFQGQHENNSRELNVCIMVDHLSSAAIRLTTIEERLRSDPCNVKFPWSKFHESIKQLKGEPEIRYSPMSRPLAGQLQVVAAVMALPCR